MIATALVTKAGWHWYEFYYLMVGAAVLEVILLISTFWKADARAYIAEHPQVANVDSGSSTLLDNRTPQPVHVNGQETRRFWEAESFRQAIRGQKQSYH